MKTLSLFALILLFAAPAFAQPAPAQISATPSSTAAVPDPDMQKRIELATKMAELSPPRQMIETAVDHIVMNAPKEDRQEARSKMLAAFDMDGFRKTVIDAMAKTFTAAELQRMVDYNSTPEAKAIAQKMPDYQRMIQPDMIKKLDVALMVARTGKPGNTPTKP